MKMKITRLHGLLLMLCVAIALYAAKSHLPIPTDYRRTAPIPAANPALQLEKIEKLHLQHQAIEIGPRPHGDGVFDGWFALKSTYPRPVSSWQTSEKSFYTKLLEKEKYDVLIVPFQVQDRAFDQATRSLLTARLTDLIKSGTSLRIPDPYLVARALGDGDRRFKSAAVYDLAQHLNVGRIIWTYAGHDQNQRMAITLTVQDKAADTELDAQTKAAIHGKEMLAFSSQNPPLVVAETALGDLVRELGYAPPAQHPDSGSCNIDFASMPESPKAMLLSASTPAQLARSYEVYSALTPNFDERSRRRFAEKAYLAVLNVSDSCPSYRLLKARALFQLGYRPLALTLLANPQTAEEKALMETLNGNYPELEKLVHDMPNDQARLLPGLDLIDIGGAYRLVNKQKAGELIQSFKLPGKFWSFFMERKFADHDHWMVQNNAVIKALLAYDLPVVGSANVNLGSDVDMALFEHSRKYWQENLTSSIDPDKVKARNFDYLDLIVAIGTDNLFRQVEFSTRVQGLPKNAMRRLDELAPVYKDHPRFALDRSAAELQMAGKNPGTDVASNLLKSAYDDAMNAMYWEQGQSQVASASGTQLQYMNRTDYGPANDLYYTDLPFHPDYVSYGIAESSAALTSAVQGAVENSSRDFGPVTNQVNSYSDRDEDKLAKFLQTLKGRFHGSPDLSSTMIELSKKKPGSVDTDALLKKAIADNPNSWKFYFDLGTKLFNQGKIEDAFTTFMSYPGFKSDIGDNAVGTTNNVAQVAMRFYHAGYFEQASALYQIADRLDTGADYGMVAHERLALMRGDLGDAMATLHERVQRYGSNTAYFEYLSMLYATGHAKEAWAIGEGLISAGQTSSLWGGANTGFRISGTSEATILKWAKKLAVGNAMQQDDINPGKFLMTAATFDRKPSMAVVDTLDQIEVPVSAAIDTPHTARRQSDAGHATVLFGFPTMSCGAQIATDWATPGKYGKFIKSERHYFVLAYREIQAKNYAGAEKVMAEAGQLYDMTCPLVTYLDPYWAFAAAKINNTAYIDNLLTLFREDDRQFDYYLTKSVLQGFKHDVDGSIASAHMARLFVTNTLAMGYLPDYSYAEMMEWLFFETKDDKYRTEALDWLAKVEKKLPWSGWAFAMEAELQSDPIRRSNAAAMARYLDPLSERLARLPKNVRDNAKFTNGNPLLRVVDRNPRLESKT
ncbi:tetratricopeptide (TPR) repeat protein [Oxalobacteraceae bacterium GrIS 2.11]